MTIQIRQRNYTGWSSLRSLSKGTLPDVVADFVFIIWATSCAPGEDADQSGHPPSLIRVFAVRMKKAWVLSYPLSAQLRLIRLGGCPGWPESSLGAHAILLVLSWSGSVFFTYIFAQFISQISTFRLIKAFFKRVKFLQCYTIFSSILSTILSSFNATPSSHQYCQPF